MNPEDIQSSPEQPQQPESVSPPVPEPQPQVEETPKKSAKKYIRRAFGFEFNGHNIQGNFYEVAGGRLDIDGWCGTLEFDNTEHLIISMKWSPEIINKFTQKVTKYLSS